MRQLFMPFLPSGNLPDAFSALAPLMPDITCRVWKFLDRLGVVVGYEHCSIMVDGRVIVLSVTIHETHGESNIAALEDVTKVAEQKRRLVKDRQRSTTISIRCAITQNIRPAWVGGSTMEPVASAQWRMGRRQVVGRR